ncbi:MAG: holo-ACP synthase [Deltaproteobacteria bacterium]|nr:holo-ACP synthase [Deltaproteobacteria bacterium]
MQRWGERFQGKVFTSGEVRYCLAKRNPYPSFAARFAAKEAFVKALGIGIRRGVHWRDVEVARGPLGKPILKLAGLAARMVKREQIEGIHLSLTHDGDYSNAMVVLETVREDAK